MGRGVCGHGRSMAAGDDVTCVYDDVTCVYDDVTYVYDDVTYVYDDVTYVYDDVTCADGLWPQAQDKFRVCSVGDCALGSCTSNSVMRQDYPMTRTFSYDSPTIFHHSTVTPSGNSAYGSTAGGWLMTIVGRNFGFYADVVNVSVASSIYDNALLSLATGRYWDGKVCMRLSPMPKPYA
jgi:hypothetical protein